MAEIPEDEEFVPNDRPQIGILVTKNFKQWDILFQKFCWAQGKDQSTVIRNLIKKYLKENKETIQVLFYNSKGAVDVLA